MKQGAKTPASISVQALQRMPYYLEILRGMERDGLSVVAAPALAEALELNEVQVRKDLAAVSPSGGKPKSGFGVAELIFHMEKLLGYHNADDAVLVGAGSLGRALLAYRGFDQRGLTIVAAFDADERVAGTSVNGKPVFPMDRLTELCRRLNIHIGIITVPEGEAQTVCDRLVESGILAIWNFAPVHLRAPKEILIRHENMAGSLALLSKHLRERMNQQTAKPEKP